MLAHYQQILETHRHRVFSFAFYSLRVREDAEDITQDVFIRLWQHWQKIDHDRVGAWLMRVAHNAVVDRVRRARTSGTSVELDEQTLEADDQFSPAQDSRQLSRILEQAICELTDPHRSILVMRDIQGLSYLEIEQVLNLSQSQVKVYLHRARRQLREHEGLRRLAHEEWQLKLPVVDVAARDSSLPAASRRMSASGKKTVSAHASVDTGISDKSGSKY